MQSVLSALGFYPHGEFGLPGQRTEILSSLTFDELQQK